MTAETTTKPDISLSDPADSGAVAVRQVPGEGSGQNVLASRAEAPPAVYVEQTMDDFIGMALRDPSVDVGKLEALLRMKREAVADQERIEDRDSILEFNDAMSACQAEIAPVARTAENKQTNSMYAKLEAVDAAIRPIYTKHGFSLSFDEKESEDKSKMRIVCYVSRKRHTREYGMFAPPDTLGPKGTPVKTELHGRGSTTTFLRRYLECNIFNVVLRNIDDDGVRGGMKFITEAEAEELRTLATAVGQQEGSFLDQLFAGAVRSFDEIEAGPGHLACRSTLEAMKRRNEKRAATKGDA